MQFLDAGIADAVFAVKLRNRRASIVLLQNADFNGARSDAIKSRHNREVTGEVGTLWKGGGVAERCFPPRYGSISALAIKSLFLKSDHVFI